MKYFLILLTIFSQVCIANSGKILFVKGTAVVSGKPLKKNDILKIGDTVTTSELSLAVIQLPQGTKVKVGPKSELKIEKLPTKDSETTTLSLIKGNSFIKVLKGKLRSKGSNKLLLKASTTAMGVRGTEFFASFGSENDVWMCVNEGTVAVKSNSEKKETLVKEGEGIVVKKGKNTSKPKPLAWTKKLNWNMDPGSGDVVNNVSIESAYSDLLNEDYD